MATEQTPSRTTLQEEINYQNSESGGFSKSFIIKNKEGDCDLSKCDFANIKFYNCKIKSLKSGISNMLTFNEGCIFEYNTGAVFSVDKSIVQINNAIINNKIIFTQSKVSFNSATVSQSLEFGLFTKVRSLNTTWKSGDGSDNKIAIKLNNGSRFESNLDYWAKWNDYFWQADSSSYIKISSPKQLDHSESNNGKGIVSLNDFSVLELNTDLDLDVTQNNNSLFNLNKKSRLDILNIGKISCDNGIFISTDSSIICRNTGDLKSQKANVFNLTNSEVELINTGDIESVGDDAIKGENSSLSSNQDINIKAKGSCIKVNDSNIIIICNSIDFNNDNNKGSTFDSNLNITISGVNSKFIFKNIDKITSNIGDSISLKNSYLVCSKINTLSGGTSGSGILADGSVIDVSNIKKINSKGSNAPVLLKLSSGKIYNIDNITSNGNANAVEAKNSSNIVCKNINNITGTYHGIFVDNKSSGIFKKISNITSQTKNGVNLGVLSNIILSDIDNISGNSSYGVNSDGTHSRIKIINVSKITGQNAGINLSDTDLELNNSGINDSTVTGSNTGISLITSAGKGSYQALITGPITVNGRTALNGNNYLVEESGITWNGDIQTTNCFIDTKYSTLNKNITAISSLIKHNITSIIGNVSLSSQSIFDGKLTSMNNLTLDKSVGLLTMAKLANVTPTGRSGLVLNTGQVGDVQLTDSYISTFGSNNGTLFSTGKSTIFGGAIQSGTINFTSGDAPFSSPVTTLSSSGGDLGIQADNTIFIEANVLQSKFRDTVTIEATNDIEIKSDSGSVKVDATTGNIDLTAANQLQAKVGSSTVTLNTDSINIYQPAGVNIN